MTHAFSVVPAKPTFGTLQENLFQSDYLTRKKAKHAYCITPSYCYKIKKVNSYEIYNLRRVKRCHIVSVNKSNLIMGQYSKLNLKDVCVAAEGPPLNECNNTPVEINPNAQNPFYWNATIDPVGELFGRIQCGQLNYAHHMQFYPPNSINI